MHSQVLAYLTIIFHFDLIGKLGQSFSIDRETILTLNFKTMLNACCVVIPFQCNGLSQ
jgi:hypothetical protein